MYITTEGVKSEQAVVRPRFVRMIVGIVTLLRGPD